MEMGGTAVPGRVYGIPLRSGVVARVVVARVSVAAPGVTLGYFFTPAKPGSDVLADLRPAVAVYVSRFGDLGIVCRRWPDLGAIEDFELSDWPVPRFVMRPALGGVGLVTYRPEDIGVPRSREAVSEEAAAGHPSDGVAGHAFVEKRLERLTGELSGTT